MIVRTSVAFLCVAMCVACRNDMYNQPKKKPLAESEFFKDGTSARPIPANTVAREDASEDVAFFVNLGMWIERFVIIITSLHRDFIPSSWGSYAPTLWDWATLFGSVGLFLMLLFLFIRLLPMISISESRELVAEPAKANAL